MPTPSTDFRDVRRHVRLDRGEALFSVAKDPSHPFFVETPTGQIRVTGTVFNVRLAHGGRLEVTVLEGSVSVQATEIPKTAVTTPSEPFRLRPGEQLTLAPEAPQVRTLSPTDLENILAWKQGRIVFEAMPLLEAAARFEEFHERTIAVAPEVATLRLSGSYSLDNLESFFGALAEALPVLVASQPDGSFRINPR